MPPIKLLVIAGARPNFMKVAPLFRAIAEHNRSLPAAAPTVIGSLVHTGQHYDATMSGVFFRELGIPEPDYNLEVGSGSHASQTASIMTRFEPVLEKERPTWLVVVGDVNSTLACTLVAAKLGTPVAHIEAGLRSFDLTMPEEINRLVTDRLSSLLLTPSEDANRNLEKEGVPAANIRLVGNIMIDSLIDNLPKARQSRFIADLGLPREGFAYVTLHRPANVDHQQSLTSIMSALAEVSRTLPIVFPIHPRTRQRLASFGLDHLSSSRFRIVEPLGYHDSLALAESARLVITDSGGLQEETTYFRTPCLTLRPNTERPVTLTTGSNRLTTAETLGAMISEALTQDARRGSIPPLWDGHTSERILHELLAPRPD